MPFKTPDIINLAIAGILSLLWFDIRKFNKNREEDQKTTMEKELAAVRELHEMRDGLFEVFLKKTDHGLICENAGLKIRKDLSKKIDDTKAEILDAIKKNGSPS